LASSVATAATTVAITAKRANRRRLRNVRILQQKRSPE
jgi:hypothetical protein